MGHGYRKGDKKMWTGSDGGGAVRGGNSEVIELGRSLSGQGDWGDERENRV